MVEMKSIAVYWALGVALAGSTQTWQHTKIHSGLTFLDGFSSGYHVGHDGSALYTGTSPQYSGLQAWRMGVSLNQQYLGNSVGTVRGSNSVGQSAFTAVTNSSYHVNVDARDFFVEKYGETRAARYNPGAFAGLDENGLPFWIVRDSQESRTHVYHGDQELLSDVRNTSVKMLNMNKQGDVVWYAYTHPVGSQAEESLFLNGIDISAGVLGANRVPTQGAGINSKGQVLWSGYGDATNKKWHLFLDSTDLTLQYGLLERQAMAYKVTNSGHFLWRQFALDNTDHLMRDTTDISNEAFMGARHGFVQNEAFMSGVGNVGWTGVADNGFGQRQVFFNTTDISSNLVGFQSEIGDTVRTVGIDEDSNVLWMGQGAGTNHRQEVFVNQLNLSQDALGSTPYRDAWAWAISENGHVLWHQELMDGTFTMWLSTPVPEPSSIVALFAVVAILSRRRNTR